MNSNEMYSNRDPHSYYLAHYGVLGMKWGVRHDPKTAGNSGFFERRRKKHADRIQKKRKEAERQRNDYLFHHGIKGQKWGKRNGPPYPLSDAKHNKVVKKGRKFKSYNLDRWGKSKDKNILFITGLSGSGKSTKAIEIAKNNNAEIIHMDPYMEVNMEDSNALNKNFNKYLEKNFPEYKHRPKSRTSEYGKWLDKYEHAILDYGKKLYPKKKLVVEGIQILDTAFILDKNYFKDKPLIIMSTGVLKSQLSASIRDGKSFMDFMSTMTDKEHWDFRRLYKKYANMLIADVEKDTDHFTEYIKSTL